VPHECQAVSVGQKLLLSQYLMNGGGVLGCDRLTRLETVLERAVLWLLRVGSRFIQAGFGSCWNCWEFSVLVLRTGFFRRDGVFLGGRVTLPVGICACLLIVKQRHGELN